MPPFSVVTGAFSYTGRYIAQRLLERGHRVKTLSRRRPSEHADPRLDIAPLDFTDTARLTNDLRGADALFNTYWVRFAYGQTTFESAVANTERLFRAAHDAGVGRIVHLSVTRASTASPLPYFRGKGQVEAALRRSGLSYAIIRPSLIFGPHDILLNNIAWLLRRFPLFGVPGTGDYRVQPVSVEDVADLALVAAERTDDIAQDAVGPDTYTFEGLVRLLADAVGSPARLVHIPPAAAMVLVNILGFMIGDVVLTSQEMQGLMAGLLVSEDPPTGSRRFSEWVSRDGGTLGRHYTSELARNYR